MAEALKMKVDTLTEKGTESYDLPDARDGLTPRQRRILWAMRKRKLSSRAEYEMTARTLYDAGGHVGTTSDHPFPNCQALIIHCQAGTQGEAYVNEQHIPDVCTNKAEEEENE